MKVRRDEFTFASVDCGTIFPSFIVLAVRDAVIHFLFAFCLLVIQTLICLTEQFSYDGLTKITTHFVICKGLRGTVTSRFSNSYYISNIKVSLQHLLTCFGLKNFFFRLSPSSLIPISLPPPFPFKFTYEFTSFSNESRRRGQEKGSLVA